MGHAATVCEVRQGEANKSEGWPERGRDRPMIQKKIPTLKDLTPAQRRRLERGSARWHKKFAAAREAIRRSGRITAKDLAVTITRCD